MGLESATYISDLVTTNPVGGTDAVSQGDDHLRLLKSVLQTTFPNASAGFRFEAINPKSADYTLAATDARALITVDTSGGDVTIDSALVSALPSAFTVTLLKKTSANTLTFNPTETVNGAASVAVTTQYQAISLWSDGSEWYAFRHTVA